MNCYVSDDLLVSERIITVSITQKQTKMRRTGQKSGAGESEASWAIILSGFPGNASVSRRRITAAVEKMNCAFVRSR